MRATVLAVAVAMTHFGGAPLLATVTPPQCPARIDTAQSLRTPVVGWTAERRDVGHVLDGISFFAGPVSERNELAPADASGIRFRIADAGAAVRLVCRYRGTDVTVSRPVPAGVRECSVGGSRGSAKSAAATVTCR